MKSNKNIIVIILLVIALILISLGTFLLMTSNSKETSSPNPPANESPSPSPDLPIEPDDIEPTPPMQEKEYISKEEALNLIKNIHEIEGQTIIFKEEKDTFYIFEQQNSESVGVNTFKFNKETGEIIKEEKSIEAPNNL